MKPKIESYNGRIDGLMSVSYSIVAQIIVAPLMVVLGPYVLKFIFLIMVLVSIINYRNEILFLVNCRKQYKDIFVFSSIYSIVVTITCYLFTDKYLAILSLPGIIYFLFKLKKYNDILYNEWKNNNVVKCEWTGLLSFGMPNK